MAFSDTARRIIDLCYEAEAEWDAAVRAAYPDYPLTGPSADGEIQTPAVRAYTQALAALPADQLYLLYALSQLIWRKYPPAALGEYVAESREGVPDSSDLAEHMSFNFGTGPNLEDSLELLAKQNVDVDRLVAPLLGPSAGAA